MLRLLTKRIVAGRTKISSITAMIFDLYQQQGWLGELALNFFQIN
jgi:hypothetical protein